MLAVTPEDKDKQPAVEPAAEAFPAKVQCVKCAILLTTYDFKCKEDLVKFETYVSKHLYCKQCKNILESLQFQDKGRRPASDSEDPVAGSTIQVMLYFYYPSIICKLCFELFVHSFQDCTICGIFEGVFKCNYLFCSNVRCVYCIGIDCCTDRYPIDIDAPLCDSTGYSSDRSYYDRRSTPYSYYDSQIPDDYYRSD